MGKKASAKKVTVFLECSSCRTSGLPGVNRYAIKKNKKKNPKRLELNKYCPCERKHTLHKEVR